MGKNIFSLSIWQRADIQNLQRTQTDLQGKTNKPIQKWAKDMNRHFTKEDIHKANKHMKKCLSSLTLERCKSKLCWDTISCQLEWWSLKNLETTDAGEDVEKKEHFYTVGGSINQFKHCGRQCGDSSRT